MFGKVNPAPAVSKSIRMVFRSLPEPLKAFKTIKNNPKLGMHDILFFLFLLFLVPIGPVFGPYWKK